MDASFAAAEQPAGRRREYQSRHDMTRGQNLRSVHLFREKQAFPFTLPRENNNSFDEQKPPCHR
jgi:hypothetical protein